MSAPDEGPLALQLLLLTTLTGVVDAVSYLGLGHVFVANMTGNIAFFGFGLSGAAGFTPSSSLLATTSFLVGAVLAGCIGHAANHKARLLRTVSAFNCIVALLALLGSVSIANSGLRVGLLTALLAIMMGMQNAVARRLAVADLTTTVLTLTLTGIAADSFLAGGKNPRLYRRIGSVAMMFIGALSGAAIFALSGIPLCLTVVIVLNVSVLFLISRYTRSADSWVAF